MLRFDFYIRYLCPVVPAAPLVDIGRDIYAVKPATSADDKPRMVVAILPALIHIDILDFRHDDFSHGSAYQVTDAAAVFFLVRNRWAAVTIASLIASYGSYAFWRFFDGDALMLACMTNMDQVRGSRVKLIVMPMKISSCAAPCRAVENLPGL